MVLFQRSGHLADKISVELDSQNRLLDEMDEVVALEDDSMEW